MKIMLVANQKGGVSKSIISYNWAHYFADKGKRVLFIDADPQANSTSSMRNYLGNVSASQFFGETPLEFPATESNIVVARPDPCL